MGDIPGIERRVQLENEMSVNFGNQFEAERVVVLENDGRYEAQARVGINVDGVVVYDRVKLSDVHSTTKVWSPVRFVEFQDGFRTEVTKALMECFVELDDMTEISEYVAQEIASLVSSELTDNMRYNTRW
ncbi:hypothetical protein [Halorubrum sp. C191]|uniref:hypothetical protein n=1 Tax=Halorubrum sp. C191 TaxID=1383842 RepID=UPI0011819071|nr:hypothetical protein [Halorubrum sp. C191]